jgi:hypothetical protein
MAKQALAGSAAGRQGWKVSAQFIAAPCSAWAQTKMPMPPSARIGMLAQARFRA